MKTAFIFPGQGAQVVGMGSDVAQRFPQASGIFDKANDIVGYDLKTICFEGPQDKLNSTTISQPAIFVTSAAILEVLRTNDSTSNIKPDVTAGLSLGEYSALYAAGRMSFEDALNLVQKRGDAMQAAADASDGGMVTLLKMDDDKLNELIAEAAQGELLVAANFNCPGQTVISGTSEACQRAADLADKYGALKAIVLNVAGAFHSDMMSPAAESLTSALAQTLIADEAMPTLANINAKYYTDADSVRDGLAKQLTQSILWQKSMECLLEEGIEKYYEIGPGRVLTSLMKKINRKTKVVNLSTAAALEELIAS